MIMIEMYEIPNKGYFCELGKYFIPFKISEALQAYLRMYRCLEKERLCRDNTFKLVVL